jgi:uncharacterized membrane protein (DUF2068 family)
LVNRHSRGFVGSQSEITVRGPVSHMETSELRVPRSHRPVSKRCSGSFRPSNRVLLLIAILKLMKAALLLAVAFGALSLLHRDVAETAAGWIAALKIDPASRFATMLMSYLPLVSHRRLEEISAGTFVYAALFSTEGVGLLLGKRWAEYFTAIATGSLIPLEIYELVKHRSLPKLIIAALNVAVVWYLVARLKQPAANSTDLGLAPRTPRRAR